MLDDAAVRDELARLRDAGVFIGFTATGPRQADTIERALEVGGFDAVQATWNLHERSATAALAAAHDAGLGVIVKEALANGRLTARADTGPLAEAARERATTPDALALAAVLAQPWVDVVLSGVATVDTLRSNLAALDVAWDAELEERLAGLAEPAEAYWERGPSWPGTERSAARRRAVLGGLVEGELAVERVVVRRAPAARDDGVLGVRTVGRGVGGSGRGHRVGRRGRRVVDQGLGHVRRPDAVARVREQRPAGRRWNQLSP